MLDINITKKSRSSLGFLVFISDREGGYLLTVREFKAIITKSQSF